MHKKIWSLIQQILKYFDLFPFSSFIRFKGQTDYKTATGGFFSFSIIILFAVLFTNLGIKTIDRQIINWSSSITNSQVPTLANIMLQKQSFMFAISIMGININDPNKRYFDIQVSQKEVKTGMIPIGSRSIAMGPCTESHFSKTENLKKSFNSIPSKNSWYCPNIGQSFQLFGKFGSEKMKYLKIDILKCNSSLYPNRPCVNQTQIDTRQATVGPFILGFFYVNPLINPGDSNYLDYYIQDKNFFTFSTQIGAFSTLYLQQFSIQTDNSILPYSSISEDKGLCIPEALQNSFLEVIDSQFANIMLFKSRTSMKYERSFYKLDDLLSYIGGLVGVVLIALLFLTSYNQFAFQHQMAHELFAFKEPISAPNIFSFLKISIFTFFRRIWNFFFQCSKLESALMIYQQVGKQLDLSLLINRILFLQKSVRIIFDTGQLQALQLSRKDTIQNSKRYRQYYNAHNFLQQSKIPPQDSQMRSASFSKIYRSIANHSQNQQISFDEENIQSYIVSIKRFEESVKTCKKKSLKVYRQLTKNGIFYQRQNQSIENLNEHLSNESIMNPSAVEHLKENMQTIKMPIVPGSETFNFDQFQ